MKFVVATLIKPLLTSAACAFLLAVGATAVRADGLPVSGSTFGCFADIGCIPSENEATFQGLTFTAADFDLGSSGRTINLGTLSLSRAPNDYNGAEFLIFYLFEEPPFAVFPDFGFDGAELLGAVNEAGFGGVNFGFIIGPQEFDFNGRLFRVTVNSTFVPAGGTVDLTADVVVVPEPTTMVLLGTGLAGISAIVKRRRRT